METNRISEETAYELLAMAIVKQAAKDYHTEYQKSIKLGTPTRGLQRLKRWFISPYGKLLSKGKGEYIIEKIESGWEISNLEWVKQEGGASNG